MLRTLLILHILPALGAPDPDGLQAGIHAHLSLPVCSSALQFHAMDTLYRHGYDLSSAISVLVPLGGPVLCRDEMEEWSASEASLFEEALEKYGKDFNDIRQDFVSGKP